MQAHAITIRHSNHADDSALLRLAALDDRPAIEQEVLMGFVDGELRAAVALSGDQVIADPFARTAELVELLRMRAAQEPSHGSGPSHGRGMPLTRLGWAA